MPLVQRFYIDIGFLVVGGILFWELQARGELVSGSLFGEQDVNEALLVAPVLFLLAVGLMFFRVFPLFIRYVSGESLGLVHLATLITIPVLAGAIAYDDVRAGDLTGWIPEAATIGVFALAYWLSTSTAPSRLEGEGWGEGDFPRLLDGRPDRRGRLVHVPVSSAPGPVGVRVRRLDCPALPGSRAAAVPTCWPSSTAARPSGSR